MAETTLQRMAAGGMYDHVGGGFHRYSVDEHWHVPHFEKVCISPYQLTPQPPTHSPFPASTWSADVVSLLWLEDTGG